MKNRSPKNSRVLKNKNPFARANAKIFSRKTALINNQDSEESNLESFFYPFSRAE
jgi:hypothetical protein